MTNREMQDGENLDRQTGSSDDSHPDKHLQAERLLAEQLIGGETDPADAGAEAVKRLPPRWEIRIQTEHDPVEEETNKYRSMAQEVDNRYDERKRKK